jgi:hypothetical protein
MPVLLILSGWRTSGHCTRLPNELRRVVTRVDARNQASRGRRYVGSNVRLSRPISFCVGWSHRLRLTVIRHFERESAPVVYQQCGRFLPPGLRQGRDCAHPLAIQRRHRLAHDRHGGDQQLQLRQPAAGSAKLGPERHLVCPRGRHCLPPANERRGHSGRAWSQRQQRYTCDREVNERIRLVCPAYHQLRLVRATAAQNSLVLPQPK